MKEVDLSPREWQREVTLRNGLEVVIRPVRPDDEDLATECLRRVSRADLRLRYFAAVRASDPEFVKRLIHVDYSTAIVFVAIDRSSGAMIGAVRLHLDEPRQRGESAFGFQEAAGGIAGGVAAAMMNGVKRGLFSNEAGMGSAPNIAAAATPVPHHPRARASCRRSASSSIHW